MSGDDRLGCLAMAAALLFLPCGCGGCYLASNVTYSSGYRDGVVVKLSEKGVAFKTVEGELRVGGLQFAGGDGGGATSDQRFTFTVADPAVRKAIEDVRPGVRVRLHYRETLGHWQPKGDSTHFVERVETLAADPPR